jgi:hypothetical protein
MPQIADKRDVSCVALELSQSKWLCAFAPPEGVKLSLHTIRAGDHGRLRVARSAAGPCRSGARPSARTRHLLRSWVRRFLTGPPPAEPGIRTVVFDPANVPMPRRRELAEPSPLLLMEREHQKLYAKLRPLQQAAWDLCKLPG